jgi:hypothetical protein
MDSILSSTKLLAGMGEEYTVFDPQIIMYINSVFLVLKQLGVGPSKGFIITGEDELWEDFLPNDEILREFVKAYMGDKVRLKFDPPSSAAHLEALKQNINEFEWRVCNDVTT